MPDYLAPPPNDPNRPPEQDGPFGYEGFDSNPNKNLTEQNAKPKEIQPGKGVFISNTANRVKDSATQGAQNTLETGKQALKLGKDAVEALSGNLWAAKDAIVNLAKNWRSYGQLARQAGKPVLVLAFTILLIVSAPSAFALSYAFSLLQQGKGNKAIGVGQQPNDVYSTYCQGIMQPTLDWPNPKTGKVEHLVLPDTKGKYSQEDPIDLSNGKVYNDHWTGWSGAYLGGGKRSVSMWGLRDSSDVTDADLAYYVNARWGYVEWGYDRKVIQGHGLASISSYANRRVVVYSPETKKAVLGVIIETGPGVAEGNNDKEVDLRNDPQQRALWNNGSDGGYRIYNPDGYQGRTIGGPRTFQGGIKAGSSTNSALGFGFVAQNKKVVFGFAPPEMQHMRAGPITCTEAGPVKTITVGSTTQPLNVPGVQEGEGGECGIASINMITLYENITVKGSPIYTKPDDYKFWLGQKDDGTYYVKVINHFACVTPAFINTNVPSSKQGWSLKKASEVPWSAVIKSVTSGDPVLMYTSLNGFFNGKEHIIVITGYNNSTKTFYVNNPFHNGFNIAQTVVHGKPITADYLSQFYGDTHTGTFNHTFIIRDTYLKS